MQQGHSRVLCRGSRLHVDRDMMKFDNIHDEVVVYYIVVYSRKGVRGVAGVAMATPISQIMFHKILVLKWPKIPKVQIPQNPNIPKARIPKGPNA